MCLNQVASTILIFHWESVRKDKISLESRLDFYRKIKSSCFLLPGVVLDNHALADQLTRLVGVECKRHVAEEEHEMDMDSAD